MKIDSPILKASFEAASKGSQVAIEYFHNYKDLHHVYKVDNSIVTQADIECQEAIISALQKRYPSVSIISEETDEEVLKRDEVWIIDPIDGTKEFARGIENWAILIAFAREGKIFTGIAFFPMSGVIFYAEKGKGAYCNDKKLSVSRVSDLTYIFLSYSPLRNFNDNEEKGLFNVINNVGSTRSMVASQAGSFVAKGAMDCYIASNNNHIWDNAPFAVIIPEAGGTVTDWNGNELDVFSSNSSAVMSNGLLHREFLDLLNT